MTVLSVIHSPCHSELMKHLFHHRLPALHTGLISRLFCCSDFFQLKDVTVSIFDHPQSGMIYNFGGVCIYVCRKLWRRILIFTHLVYRYIQGIRVEFVYEGHRVKIKVTGAKMVQCKTSISNNSGSVKHIHEVCMPHGVFGYGVSNNATAIFVTWSEVTPVTKRTHSRGWSALDQKAILATDSYVISCPKNPNDI